MLAGRRLQQLSRYRLRVDMPGAELVRDSPARGGWCQLHFKECRIVGGWTLVWDTHRYHRPLRDLLLRGEGSHSKL